MAPNDLAAEVRLAVESRLDLDLLAEAKSGEEGNRGVRRPEGGEVIFPKTFSMGVMRGGDDRGLLFRHEQQLRRSPQDFPSQIDADERVGIAMFAVDAALAEYQALAEVEKWAARSLVRIVQG
jgi:hypothetical protein